VTSEYLSRETKAPESELELVTSIFKSTLEQDLISKIEPVLHSLGYRLRDLEVSGQSNPTVRVTIDFSHGETEKRIGVEDCEKVHRKLNPMFDLWDPIPGAYTVELSSPGEHAPLRTIEDFREAVQGTLKFKTTEPIPMPEPMKARKNWVGKLIEVTDDGKISLEDEHGLHELSLEMIQSAQWQREWTPQKKER